MSELAHIRLALQIRQASFVSSSRFGVEKKKESNGNCTAFCVTRKRSKEGNLLLIIDLVLHK